MGPRPHIGRVRWTISPGFPPFLVVVRGGQGSHGGARTFFWPWTGVAAGAPPFFMGRRRGERVRCLQGASRPPPSSAPRMRPAPRASPIRLAVCRCSLLWYSSAVLPYRAGQASHPRISTHIPWTPWAQDRPSKTRDHKGEMLCGPTTAHSMGTRRSL